MQQPRQSTAQPLAGETALVDVHEHCPLRLRAQRQLERVGHLSHVSLPCLGIKQLPGGT